MKRLARALVFLHQYDPVISSPVVRAELGTLLHAGRAMDFAARLREHRAELTPQLCQEYATHAGISAADLRLVVLPALKEAGLVDYRLHEGRITDIEEFVGVTASVLDQALMVLQRLGPSDAEWATLHSIEVGSWAPLARSQHLEALVKRGIAEGVAERGHQLAAASKVNRHVSSDSLGEDVVFNPYVWGSSCVPVAQFLRSLPSAERDVLLAIAEQASDKPGIALPAMQSVSPRMLRSARKVGLVQAATVKSSFNPSSQQTYVFSPLTDLLDDQLVTTEALHERKLLLAHILFGHEKAVAGRGRIVDPVVLTRALVRRGLVGPASNIASDYHMVEAAGIVQVIPSDDGDRAFLKLVKKEVGEGALGWLEKTFGSGSAIDDAGLSRLRPPSEFVSPERDREYLEAPDPAADEITTSAVLRLREEAQRAARGETPY